MILGKSFQEKGSLFCFLQNSQKHSISQGASPNRMEKDFSPGKFYPLGHYVKELVCLLLSLETFGFGFQNTLKSEKVVDCCFLVLGPASSTAT